MCAVFAVFRRENDVTELVRKVYIKKNELDKNLKIGRDEGERTFQEVEFI